MSDIAQILSQIASGDPAASAKLMPLVYQELRKLAAAQLVHEKPGQTLQATALVHEVYLRLLGDKENAWDNLGHFFAAAAEAMRRLLVENARRKKRLKYGGDRQRVSLDATEVMVFEPSADLLDLDEALTRLAAHDPLKAEVVKLRYFAGLSMPEIAKTLELSLPTVERHWRYARNWLYAELASEEKDSSENS